ncbi:MAG: di-heme-cytochrome C peroxidase [Rhizobiaceae bacterium]
MLAASAMLMIGYGFASASLAAETCDKGTFTGAFAGEEVIPQNWTCEERQQFWFTDQGSQIIPLSWFLHLEQKGSSTKFSDPANMDKYRYLPQKMTKLNPDKLPIGFTRGNARNNDDYKAISNNWLGMTCAACHTGQVEFEGAKILIDGAPTMGDLEMMMQDLVMAMRETSEDEDKFDRFASNVLAASTLNGDGGTGDEEELHDQLDLMVAVRHEWNERNKGDSRYGHARLDAIGAIFNETAATALNVPQNRSSANAPVSYPFIWDTPQHDKVQWNGSVTNAGPGALGRNVGEVLGVFGYLDLNTSRLLKIGHKTSVDVENLGRLEQLLWKLQSPLWSDTKLPRINEGLALKGKAVYRELCGSCHREINRTDPDRRIKAVMFPIENPRDANDPNALNTDPTMAVNFLKKTAAAHRLTKLSSNRNARYLRIFSKGEKFERANRDNIPKAKILGYSVLGTITRAFIEDPLVTLRAMKAGQEPDIAAIYNQLQERLEQRLEEDLLSDAGKIKELLAMLNEMGERIEPPNDGLVAAKCFPDGNLPCYKARPLNGIWATAPYLHNGSVRTMRQLLLPASERQDSFMVGTREFDASAMGFRDDGDFTLDTSLPGNSKTGHDGPIYGNMRLKENPEELNALLEYLKTL